MANDRSEHRKLTALVGVRLHPTEHAAALRLAQSRGQTVAAMLRQLLQGALLQDVMKGVPDGD